MSLRDKFSDIPYSQKTEEENYINSFDTKNETIDFNTLSDYEDSEQVMNAHSLSKVKERIDTVQNVIGDEVIDNLDDKKQLFQSWIDNLAATAKRWQPGAEYKYYKNDVVYKNNNSISICLQDCDGTANFMVTQNNESYYITKEAQGQTIGYVYDNDILKLHITYKYLTENNEFENHYVILEVSNLSIKFIEGNIQDIEFNIDDDVSCIYLSYTNDSYIFLGQFSDTPGIVRIYAEPSYRTYSGEIIAKCNTLYVEQKTDYWLSIYTKGERGESVYNLDYKGAYCYSFNNYRFAVPYGYNTEFKFNQQFERKDIIFTMYDDGIIRETQYILNFGFPLSANIFPYVHIEYDGEYNVVVTRLSKNSDVYCKLNEAITFIYQSDDIIFIDNSVHTWHYYDEDGNLINDSDDIDFYVCINDNVITDPYVSPAEDPTNWIKLFSVPRDKIKIYDEMPNQEFFDDPKSPSIFGVTQSTPMNEVIDIRNDKYVIDDFDTSARYKVAYYEDASQSSYEIITPSFTSTYEFLTDIISITDGAYRGFCCDVDYLTSVNNDYVQMNFNVLGSEIRGDKIIPKAVNSEGYIIDESYGLPFVVIYYVMEYEGRNLLFVQLDEATTDNASVEISFNLGTAKTYPIIIDDYSGETAHLVLLEEQSKAVITRGYAVTSGDNDDDVYIRQIIDEFHSWDDYGLSTILEPKLVFTDKIDAVKLIDRVVSEGANNPMMIAPRQTAQYIYDEDGVPLNTQIENLLKSQNLWDIRNKFGLT